MKKVNVHILLCIIIVFMIAACGKKTGEENTGKTGSNNQSSANNQNTAPQTNQTPSQDQNQTGKNQLAENPIDPITLIGSWVNPDDNMGFTLLKGGKAESINMATLDYNTWKVEGKNLVLNSKSKGVSNPVVVDEIYIIKTITPYKLVLSPSNNPNTVRMFARK